MALLQLIAATTLAAYTWAARSAVMKGLSGVYQVAPYRVDPRYKVSLIAITYNEEKYLPHLLASSHNQTEPFSEIIISDCSDNTLTASIARQAGARVIRTPKGNLSLSRNNGARAARGEILVFCDADVILAWDFVEKSIDALEAGALACHPRKAYYDSQIWSFLSYVSTGIFKPNYSMTGCFTIWGDAFWGIGGFNEGCPHAPYCMEDVEFSLRFREAYGRATILLPPLATISARRLMKQHLTWEEWDTAVRSQRRLRCYCEVENARSLR